MNFLGTISALVKLVAILGAQNKGAGSGMSWLAVVDWQGTV